MQVIRVEHPTNNRGFFRQHHSKLSISANKNYDFFYVMIQRHIMFVKTPLSEKKLDYRIDKDEFCSFKSMEQVQNLIEPDEFKKLFEMGFVVVLLELSDWREGDDQVLFKQENVIERKIITSLFKTKSNVQNSKQTSQCV